MIEFKLNWIRRTCRQKCIKFLFEFCSKTLPGRKNVKYTLKKLESGKFKTKDWNGYFYENFLLNILKTFFLETKKDPGLKKSCFTHKTNKIQWRQKSQFKFHDFLILQPFKHIIFFKYHNNKKNQRTFFKHFFYLII